MSDPVVIKEEPLEESVATAALVKQVLVIGPTVPQSTDMHYLLVEPKIEPIKNEPNDDITMSDPVAIKEEAAEDLREFVGTAALVKQEPVMIKDEPKDTQTTQEMGDIIIETNNDQGAFNSRNIVPVRVDSKAAEHSRLYRQRHREEINQRRRDFRQRKENSNQIQTLSNIQNINEIEQITDATSDNQSSNSHRQRQQRYYEEHKEEINKRKRDRRLQQNVSKSIPATAAERNRKYRQRNRQKINEQRRESRLRQQYVQRAHTECNINNVDCIDQITNSTPNDQQNLNSSNDNIIQEIAHNSTSTLENHNTQHFEETHNDRVQTTTAAIQTIEGQNSNSSSHCHLHKLVHECFIGFY